MYFISDVDMRLRLLEVARESCASFAIKNISIMLLFSSVDDLLYTIPNLDIFIINFRAILFMCILFCSHQHIFTSLYTSRIWLVSVRLSNMDNVNCEN